MVGDDCTIGHLAHLEGCTVEDGALVGTSSVVLHEAVVSRGALVGANAVVTNRMVVPPDAMAHGLSEFQPVQGRSRTATLRHRGRAITLIDDTYNANPDSVRAMIDVLAELPAPRLLVLGDMGEVGDQGTEFHAEVGAYARERGIDRLFAHGPMAIHTAMAFGGGLHFETMDALTEAVRKVMAQSATIGVKGSRFMRMERVVAAVSAAAGAATEGAHAA